MGAKTRRGAGVGFQKKEADPRESKAESRSFWRKIRRGVRISGFAVLGFFLGLRLLLFHLLGIAGNRFRSGVHFTSGVEDRKGGEEGEGLEFHGSMSSRETDKFRLRAEAPRSVRRDRMVWPPLPTILGMSEGRAAT